MQSNNQRALQWHGIGAFHCRGQANEAVRAQIHYNETPHPPTRGEGAAGTRLKRGGGVILQGASQLCSTNFQRSMSAVLGYGAWA